MRSTLVYLGLGSAVLLSGWNLQADVTTSSVAIGLDPPITYTEQVVASGTLGTATFTDALITIGLSGDTGNVTGGSGFFTNMVGTFTVDISGVGEAVFTDSMEVFVNQAFSPPAAGFGDISTGGSVLDTFNSVFASYDLTTPIGPISGGSFIRPDLSFGTTLGALNITSAGDSTFTASTSAVPEPASRIFLAAAIAAILVYRVRRRFALP